MTPLTGCVACGDQVFIFAGFLELDPRKSTNLKIRKLKLMQAGEKWSRHPSRSRLLKVGVIKSYGSATGGVYPHMSVESLHRMSIGIIILPRYAPSFSKRTPVMRTREDPRLPNEYPSGPRKLHALRVVSASATFVFHLYHAKRSSSVKRFVWFLAKGESVLLMDHTLQFPVLYKPLLCVFLKMGEN